MSDRDHLPPAPVHQQAPPTRAAASDSQRSLRDARGSLPLMTGTASHRASRTDAKARREDARCWYEGYWAGRRGEPMRAKPHPTGAIDSWSWVGGFIEGKDRREKDTRHA